MAGAVLGGYVSATASGVQIEGVSPLASYVGGFCLYMGARIGGGCTRYSMLLLECKAVELFFN